MRVPPESLSSDVSQLTSACTAGNDLSLAPHSSPDYPWYAIRVRSNYEKNVGIALNARGYQEFVPLYRKRSQWTDRVASLEVPLFPGYVFCRLNIEKRLPVLTAPGVVSIVGFGSDFISVPDAEIDAIRHALTCGALVLPHPYLRVGQRVRIERGAMTGVEGLLLRVRDDFRLVVSINILMRSVAIQIDRDWISPIN